MNLFENILNKAKVNFANPDPTQNLQFKALQGASNLYTGVAEEASMWGQREFERKKQIAKEFLAKKGYSPELIESTLSQIERQPSFMGRVTEWLGNRMQELAKTTETLSNEQNLTKRLLVWTLAYWWDVVATAMEPIASAVSPYVQAGIEKVWLAPTVQNLGQQFQGFKERNPLTGEAIEGAFNIGQLAPMPLAKPLWNLAKQGGKAIVRWAEKVAPRVVQGVKTGVKATGEWVGKVTKSIVSQQSGLWTPAIESILKRPELQWKIRSGELSGAKTLEEARSSIDALREWYRETGKMYDTVRKSNVKVPTSEAKQVLVSQLELDGLASGWKLNLVDLPVKDRGAITQALKYIDEYKWEMTPQGALSIRQKLDDLINYNSEVGSNWQRIVTGLRAKYDEFLWNKLPWLKEIDAKYAPERQFWESIRKDIYKADGTLKDNALSVVSNITNKGNEARLARMESILPWIGEKVKALKAFEDIQNASGIKVGTYGRAATTGAIALASVPLAIASWVATHPVVVARVLEWIGLASQKIKLILAKWKNITKEDATIIQQAVAKTPKSKVENIINNLSYDPKTSKLTSKTLTKNGNTSIRPVAISNKWNVWKVEQKTIVTPKKPTPNTIKNESSQTQANWPRVIWKMGKVETKTSPQSATSYEAGMRRPFTMQSNNPIVKRVQEKPSNSKGWFIKIPEIGKKVEAKLTIDKTISDEAKSYWHTFESLEKEFDKLLNKYLAIPRKLTKEVWDNVSWSEKFVSMLWWNDLDYSAGIKLNDMWFILADAPWLFEKIPVAEKPLVLEYLKQNQWPTYETILKTYNQSKSIPVNNPLVEEARKYKSAEEFEKNFKKIYHQTWLDNSKNIELNWFDINKKWVWFNDPLPSWVNTKNTNKELKLWNWEQVQMELFIDKNKIKDLQFTDRADAENYLYKNSPEYRKHIDESEKLNKEYNDKYGEYIWARPDWEKLLWEWKNKLDSILVKAKSASTNYLKSKWYNAIYIERDVWGLWKWTTENYIILDPSIIKTKAQIKQIYEQSKSIVKNPLVEEARKYKSAEEFIKAVWEWKVKTNWFNISSDRFFGKNANISFWNVREISKPDLWRESSKYRETVDYWKEQIKKWERPVVQVSYADKNTKMIKWKTFKVTDWNHRLQAYKELWIKDIPIERFSDDWLVLKKELTELFKKLNPQ